MEAKPQGLQMISREEAHAGRKNKIKFSDGVRYATSNTIYTVTQMSSFSSMYERKKKCILFVDLYIIKTKHWDDSLTNHIATLHAALIWKPLWIHEGRVPLQACL